MGIEYACVKRKINRLDGAYACLLYTSKLAGVLSEGMLLCAEDADGNLALMTPEKKMPAGAEIC